jgi:hypothetical protein
MKLYMFWAAGTSILVLFEICPDDGQGRSPKHIEFYNRINLDNKCI